jgi:hypothetical protein
MSFFEEYIAKQKARGNPSDFTSTRDSYRRVIAENNANRLSGSPSSSYSSAPSRSSSADSYFSTNEVYYRAPVYEFNPSRQESGYSVSGIGNYYG